MLTVLLSHKVYTIFYFFHTNFTYEKYKLSMPTFNSNLPHSSEQRNIGQKIRNKEQCDNKVRIIIL